MAATNMLVFGQGAQVSKAEFNTKVSQLNTLLDQNKADEAKIVWEDVHKMMMASMSNIKTKINEASSNTDKDKLTNLMKGQFAIYSAVIKVRDNMVQNKTTIKTKLKEFGAGIL